jgi:DNA-binding FadR family transcriptional regulator
VARGHSTIQGDEQPTRAEVLAFEIERRIADGSLVADERIGTKSDLHRSFGVGVATVNVAVRLLESRGLIEARPGPGGGIFVSDLVAPVRLNEAILGFGSADVSLADWLAVYRALELLVIEEAVRLRTEADVRDLREILARIERSAERSMELLELNCRLHRRKAQICRNATLKGLYLTLLDHVRDGVGRVYRAPGFDADACIEKHARLVEAIAIGDLRSLSGEPGTLDVRDAAGTVPR